MAQEQPPINFVEIFRHRFRQLPILPPEIGSEVAQSLTYLGIGQVKRRSPVIAFLASPDRFSKDNFMRFDTAIKGLWIEDPNTLDNDTQPHFRIEQRFSDFINRYGLYGYKWVSAEIIQDAQDKKHLLLDEIASYNYLRSHEDVESQAWIDLSLEYEIDSVLGDFPNYKTGELRVTIATSDLIGKLREERFLTKLAREKSLTNTQYLRFRRFALCAKDAGLTVNYNELVNSIIAEN